MRRHNAHLIVTLLSQEGSQIDRCLLLTRLMAAATKAFDAIGIYWGYGTVVLSAEQFQEIAADSSREDLPLLAWIEFRVQQDSSGSLNMLTTGLDYFGCPEIEVLGSKRPVSEVLEAVGGLATILLQGETVEDGDTVGPDKQTRIRVRHARSHWDREGKVLRLEM